MSEDTHQPQVLSMKNGSTITAVSGGELKAVGIGLIQRRQWHDKAFCELRAFLKDNAPDSFSCDQVREYVLAFLPDPAPHPNSWGALLSAAAKAKLIERVGFEPSRSPSAHGRIVSAWRKASVSFPTSQEKPDRV